MTEATAVTGVPPAKDTTGVTPEADNKAEKQAAREAARRHIRGIVDDRKSVVDHRVRVGKENPANLSAGDHALFTAAVLDQGFSNQTLLDNPQGISLSEDGSGLAITTERNGVREPVQVLKITDQKIETDQNRLTGAEQPRATSYTCIIDGDPDPIEIPAIDIQNGFLASNASLIAESFPADDTLVTWGLQDTDNNEDIPPAVDEALRKEADPMSRANRVFEIRIAQLQVDIKTLEGKDLKEAQKLLAELECAMKANGSELGAWAKMKGLKALEEVGVNTSQLQTELQSEANKGQQLFDQLLATKNLTDNERKALSTKDLNAILADKNLMGKLLSIDGLKEKLFGDTPDSELGDIAKKFLTPEQFDKLQQEHGMNWWKIALLIAAGIIAAIPATAVVAGVGAGAATINALGNQR